MCVYICIYNVYILHIMYISPIHSVSLVTVTNTDAELIVGCHGEHENISSSACFKVRLLPQWLGVYCQQTVFRCQSLCLSCRDPFYPRSCPS